LIDRIELRPRDDRHGAAAILHGDLAQILALIPIIPRVEAKREAPVQSPKQCPNQSK
jgi:hypothetical protein